jgi:hypothetical protein
MRSSAYAKTYRGMPPRNGLLAARIKHGDELWRLYVRKTERAAYIEWKLAIDGYAPHKGNYWFSWIVKEERLYSGRSRDVHIMRDGRPALYAMTMALVRELVMEYDDPRLLDSSFEPNLYDATPSTPGEPTKGMPGVGVGVAPTGSLSGSTPGTPSVPPPISGGVAGSRGAGDGAGSTTTGDPDEDLL